VTIPASVEVICESCFAECFSLTFVIFENVSKLSRIEKEAFYGTGLVTIEIPESVQVIGERCFSWCQSLTSITFRHRSKLREHLADLLAGFAISSPDE
jgi:hypothetical protein